MNDATIGAKRARTGWLLSGPALALIVFLLVLPVLEMAVISFRREDFGQLLPGFTLANYASIVQGSVYAQIFLQTFGAAALVTVLCIALGFPVAAAIADAPPKWRGLLYFLVAAPLLVNTVVRTYGWLLILGRKGLLNELLIGMGLIGEPLALSGNYVGLIIGGTQVFLPFMILSITTSLVAIDRRLVESSQILGAGPLRTFFDITWPLAMPGVIAGSVLVFSLMLGAFVTPLILGGTAVKYLSVAIYTDALVLFNLPRATALAMVLLLVVLLAYGLQKRLLRRYEERA
ncbi:MAG: ABC transporter permease [Burkholderiaceae bacterium]|nr:ABC transporter permease [Burkholderiaceae bacterium]